MKQKKLVIVTYSFPPVNSIASRRWSEMLPILSKEYKVYVFTSNRDGNMHSPINSIEVVRFNCTGISQSGNSNAEGKRNYTKLFIAYLRSGLRTIDSTLFDFYFNNKKEFVQKLHVIKPDLIITSVGPFSAAFFGLLAKKTITGIKWIVDIRDSMSLYPYYKKNVIKVYLDKKIDRYIIRKSDSIFTVSESLAKVFTEFYGKNCKVIFNGFTENDQITTRKWDEDNSYRTIYYGGKLYGHQLKAFYLLCRVLEKFNNTYKLKMRIVDEEYRQLLIEELKKFSFDYEVLPSVDDEAYKKELGEAAILLLLEDIDKKSIIGRGTLTGKLFNYMPFKIPVLTICRNDSDIKSILTEVNRGVVCETDIEIADFLNGDLNKYEGNNLILNYTRENQARILTKLLNEF